jgi:RNA polymerase sigma-70 factor, ECF subfamily
MKLGLPKSDWQIQLDRFEQLAKAAEPTLFRAAYRLTGNMDDAKDLLQDGLLEAFKAFAGFRPDGSFERWLIRIMTNTFIDGRRRKAVRPQTIRLADLSQFGDPDSEKDVPDTRPHPEDEALASEFRDVLNKALERLPDEYRTALILCDMEGFSYAEAAEAMDCPEGTVRSRLHRARQSVRQTLGPYLKIDNERRYFTLQTHSGGKRQWNAKE